MCQLIWAFISALNDPVPSIDCEKDIVTLEFHGDETTRLASKLFELDTARKRGAVFLPSPLPAELIEVLQ